MSEFEVGDSARTLSGHVVDLEKKDIWTTGEPAWIVRYDDGDRSLIRESLLDPIVTETVPDPVEHPQHYSAGMPEGVQVIDIIRAQGADFLHGNVIKYALRWKYKNGVEDLKKAQQYLIWLLEQEEAKNAE